MYAEKIDAPNWLKWTLLLGLVMIISTMGARIGSGNIGGTEDSLVWIAALVSGTALLFVYWNFLTLEVTVTDGNFTFAYGLVRHTVVISEIESLETGVYQWARYGGWGYSRGPAGRRAWNIPGIKAGVIVVLEESGKRREYFISSRHPLELEKVIRMGITKHNQ